MFNWTHRVFTFRTIYSIKSYFIRVQHDPNRIITDRGLIIYIIRNVYTQYICTQRLSIGHYCRVLYGAFSQFPRYTLVGGSMATQTELFRNLRPSSYRRRWPAAWHACARVRVARGALVTEREKLFHVNNTDNVVSPATECYGIELLSFCSALRARRGEKQ